MIVTACAWSLTGIRLISLAILRSLQIPDPPHMAYDPPQMAYIEHIHINPSQRPSSSPINPSHHRTISFRHPHHSNFPLTTPSHHATRLLSQRDLTRFHPISS